MSDRQGEAQYEELVAFMKDHEEKMGFMTGWGWYDDPRRLTFTLSRYKFVSKMFDGYDHVMEVGCGDGFGTRIVSQTVDQITALDFDPELLESGRAVMADRYKIDFHFHDMLKGPFDASVDGIYSLDVLEHISVQDEDLFLTNMLVPLAPHGACIIGTPSLESQDYASKYSKMGHINCKTQPQLKETMARFFHNVFIFSMNDEVVHTGFSKMSHYNFALCTGRKT